MVRMHAQKISDEAYFRLMRCKIVAFIFRIVARFWRSVVSAETARVESALGRGGLTKVGELELTCHLAAIFRGELAVKASISARVLNGRWHLVGIVAPNLQWSDL
jgi:hypothetical protein